MPGRYQERRPSPLMPSGAPVVMMSPAYYVLSPQGYIPVMGYSRVVDGLLPTPPDLKSPHPLLTPVSVVARRKQNRN
jgi:hypothetical protein